ncbi:MAG: elongation factor G [Bacteroidales bacterium]|nr:elongation factor G [Bacteroidales bacterium]
MKVYQTSDIRNIALMGGSGSGKTTLSESMAFAGGHINRRGEVEKQSTVSDYKEVEHAQGNSVFTSLLYTEFNNKKINILDTPGGDDFIGSIIAPIKIADTGVLVLNCQNGIEIGAEIGWRVANEEKKPVVILASHLDHEHVNFEKTIDEAKDLLSSKVTIVQYPINQGIDFNAVIDVIKMKMIKWDENTPEGQILDIPAEEMDKAEEMRSALIEMAAESDEALMEIFFENDGLTEEQLMDGLKKGLLSRELFPVFCSSAKKNYGVNRLLEFITNVAPSPDMMPATKTTDDKEVACDSSAPTSVLFFKTTNETHVGEVLFFKVMSGKLTENQDLVNQTRGAKERVSQILAVQGKKKDKVSEMYAGDLGATVKLKETKFGDTLSEKSAAIKFPKVIFPAPKFWTAIKAESESDEEKLAVILNKYHEEDPTFTVEYSKELKQVIVRGQGEYHINTVKWHLDNLYKIPVTFMPSKIPYRETITKAAKSMYRHKKQSGGAGQFGEVHMAVEPYVEGKEPTTVFKLKDGELVVNIRDTQEYELEWGGKFIFHNCIVGGSIDKNYMPGIVKGINEKLERSPLTKSYVRDVRVFIFDGKMHPVDSNELSFKLAGRNAFDIAFKEAGPKIMEPVYNIDVIVPGDFMGDVMSDLQGRRAIILGMSSEGRYERLKAKVPLAELNRYSTALSSMTSGRATYTMEFDDYAQVPPDVQDKLIKELAEDDEE